MRALRISLAIVVLLLPLASGLAQTADEVSAAQLKAEIQKLEAIEQDKTLSTEVRDMNRTFLNKRRLQLQTLLQKKIDDLQRYLTTVGASLQSDERALVQNTIKQTEQEMRGLTEQSDLSASRGVSGPAATESTGPTFVPLSAGGATNVSRGEATVSPVSSPAAVVTASAPIQPQDSTSLNAALNAKIQAKLDALAQSRVDQTDNTKQTENPSTAEGSGPLVDQSSASDLIGLAANLAGLSASSNDNQPDPSSVAVTASAYSLLAAIKRVDPLNPVFYNQNRNWRKFSVTLGYDDEDQPDGTKQRAKIFGGKFMFINRRDPGLTRNEKYIEKVSDHLKDATARFGKLSDRVIYHLYTLEAVRRNIVTPGFRAFLETQKPKAESALQTAQAALANAKAVGAAQTEIDAKTNDVAKNQATLERINEMLSNPGGSGLFALGNDSMPAKWSLEERQYHVIFANEFLGADYRQKLGDEVVNALDQYIDQQLTEAELLAFKNLNDSAREAVESIRRAPQFSVAFNAKQRRIGFDEYLGTLIFDYGVANRVNLTLNGAYTYNDSKIIGGDTRGFKFGGQLRFQLNRENLLGKKPLFFDVATQGSWMNNTDAIYKAQGKLTIPIADGIDFPISVTYANRTNLIDEKEVRGQFGFTLDTARLMRMFLFR